ncbi:MAG: hypothetical protein LC650_00695 [Actinobacteria bacterium]|nr:hypothetical protein [Actinomycetota bacterium]
MLPDHDTMVLNVLAMYAEATPAERADGFAWYATAREAAANIAQRTGLPVEVVVAVIAVTSPQKLWQSNLGWAERICSAHVAGRPLPREGLGNSLRRAAIALTGDLSDVLRTSGSLKVRNFYLSILGAPGSPCVDRHALRVVLGDPMVTPPGMTDARYLAAAAAYSDAARELRVAVRHVQAVTWTVAKRLRDTADERDGAEWWATAA